MVSQQNGSTSIKASPRELCWVQFCSLSLSLFNDISPVNVTKCLMTKFADDITLSIAVKVNVHDPSEAEVENVKKRARDNRLVLHTKKTRETVERGRTKKSLPQQVEEVERKQELKILGVTFNKNPCNWDTQFDSIRLECTFCVFTSITGSQFLKIIHQLFNSLVIPIFFLYGIEVWGGAYQSKYIHKIYTFFKRALSP